MSSFDYCTRMRLFAFVILAFLGTANAAERVFASVPMGGQQVRYVEGEAFVVVQTERAHLFVAYLPSDKKSALLKLGVSNVAAEPFNIAETSITASAAGASLPVMTYKERLAAHKKQQRWADMAVGLGMAANNINASNAGYESSYGTYSSSTNATVYGRGGAVQGNASTYGSYYGRNYNAVAAQLAQANANAQNEVLAQQQLASAEMARLSIEDRALRANTLEPGQSTMGDVQFTLPKRDKAKPAEFTVVIDLAGQPVSILYREQ